MKKIIFITAITSLLFFNQKLSAQTKKGNNFEFCSNSNNKVSIKDMEECNLKSKTDKSIVVKSFVLSYKIKNSKGDYSEVNITGDKVPANVIESLKSSFSGDKIILEKITYEKDGKNYEETCVLKFSDNNSRKRSVKTKF